MYFKLALNNVKKSFKDYAIYFLTLTFSVCIFYIFNAIESQKAMMMVSETTDMMIQNLAMLIGYLSIFIAVVLGFLVLYANKFLIRRRKKELGLYLLLGMSKSKISCILIIETLMIGLCSLVVGITLGIFLSQALSVFTAQLFGAQMTQFQFVFSKNGFYKSLGCFAIVYLVVIIFNVTTLSKCKLIDLIEANKKNETPKVKNLKRSVVLFILSLILLTTAYFFIIQNGLMALDIYFYSAIVLVFLGTFIFFMSLSGFLLKIIQCSKKIYYNELNMFIFRQLNSKINTTYISMTFICLMLAVTIVTLSSGMAMNQSMKDELERLTPYDASFLWQKNLRKPEVKNRDVEVVLEQMGVQIQDYAQGYVKYDIYETPIKFESFFEGEEISNTTFYMGALRDDYLGGIAVSDYNRILQLQGIAPIVLEEDEFAINCQKSELLTIVEGYLKNDSVLNYEGNYLKPKLQTSFRHTLYVQVMGDLRVFLILPDEVIQRDEIASSIINLNYKSPDMEEQLIKDIEEQVKQMEGKEEQDISINGLTRTMVYDASVGMTAVMTYLTVYISLIFLLTSAAILALQQLTEAEDNKVRYQLLNKVGIEKRMIHRALLIQILIYFLMPLLLAIIHGAVGIYVAHKVIVVFGKVNILSSIIFTAGIFVAIYGVYFIGTYLSSKNVIK